MHSLSVDALREREGLVSDLVSGFVSSLVSGLISAALIEV